MNNMILYYLICIYIYIIYINLIQTDLLLNIEEYIPREKTQILLFCIKIRSFNHLIYKFCWRKPNSLLK